jgi:flavin reductase (DIM6/NTAB) family NADH-FMN oxidoreductase RutF
MPIPTAEFRSALRHFPAGVTVVTTRDADGAPCGLTASAFTSVSLNPPLVLVCIDHAATAYRAFMQADWFAVNILAKGQEHLSRLFATTGADKFTGVAFRDGQGRVPILDDVVATLECKVAHRYAGGDHTIFVGQVEGVSVNGGAPLVYCRGTYHHVGADVAP